MRNATISDIIVYQINDIVSNIIWKSTRGEGALYVIDARNELGYRVTEYAKEPLLDQKLQRI